MRQNKERAERVGHIETKENVIECSAISFNMRQDHAISTHFDNLVATYGEAEVKRMIENRFNMRQVKSRIKAA